MGDFNVNMLTQNNFTGKITEMCNLLQINQVIKDPTRVTPHSKTLIDLIFVSDALGDLESSIHSVGLSDHSLIYVIVTIERTKNKPKTTTFRSFRKFKEDKFRQELAECNWDNIVNNLSVEKSWDNFKGRFNNICNKHAPFVTVRKKVNGAPWISEEYLTLARERDFFKRKHNIT